MKSFTPNFFYKNTFLPVVNKKVQLLPMLELNNSIKMKYHFKMPTSIYNTLNLVIDYYLTSNLLNHKNLHSKKAAVIIAQIIESGHFSKRTIYLVNTQAFYLQYKIKLLHYFSNYKSSCIASNLNSNVVKIYLNTPMYVNFINVDYLTNKNLEARVHKVPTSTHTNLKTLPTLITTLLQLS